MHVALESARKAVEYFPAAQSVQFDTLIWPSLELYVPAWHPAHVDTPDPLAYVPALHATHELLPLPAANDPGAHGEQALTGESAHRPAVQTVQTLAPAELIQPFAHVVQFGAPLSENVPIVHVPHSVAPLRFAGDENLPVPQTSHVLFRPSIVENVPRAHSSQSASVVFEQALHPV